MTGSAGSLSGGEARATQGGPHLQERLAAGGRDMEETGGASSEPESAGRVWGGGGGGGKGCGGRELAAGTGLPGSRARRQTREARASTVCNLEVPQRLRTPIRWVRLNAGLGRRRKLFLEILL